MILSLRCAECGVSLHRGATQTQPEQQEHGHDATVLSDKRMFRIPPMFRTAQNNGAFKNIEELMSVRGVGEKSFLKLRSLITVMPPKRDRAAQ